MKIAGILAASLALLIPATRLPAQSLTSPDVVVEGRRAHELQQLLKAMAPSRDGRQVARWRDRVCTRIYGLEPAHADFVRKRIEDVAAGVRIRIDRSAHCEPNIIVVFSLDADALTAELVKRYPEMVGDLDSGAVNRRSINSYLAPRPVRWFGRNVSVAEEVGMMSRIRTNARREIQLTYTIVDLQKLNGITWGQLGDFLAFVSLARPEFDRGYTDRGTILSLFSARDAGTAAPSGLTELDRNLLTALYRSNPEQSARDQQQEIRARVREAMQKRADP